MFGCGGRDRRFLSSEKLFVGPFAMYFFFKARESVTSWIWEDHDLGEL